MSKSLSEQLDEIEERLGIEPLGVSCDGGCGTKLTRNDERYSRMVEPMVMILCPECAEKAEWIDE